MTLGERRLLMDYCRQSYSIVNNSTWSSRCHMHVLFYTSEDWKHLQFSEPARSSDWYDFSIHVCILDHALDQVSEFVRISKPIWEFQHAL